MSEPTYTVDEILAADDARIDEIWNQWAQNYINWRKTMRRSGVEFTPEQKRLIAEIEKDEPTGTKPFTRE